MHSRTGYYWNVAILHSTQSTYSVHKNRGVVPVQQLFSDLLFLERNQPWFSVFMTTSQWFCTCCAVLYLYVIYFICERMFWSCSKYIKQRNWNLHEIDPWSILTSSLTLKNVRINPWNIIDLTVKSQWKDSRGGLFYYHSHLQETSTTRHRLSNINRHSITGTATDMLCS